MTPNHDKQVKSVREGGGNHHMAIEELKAVVSPPKKPLESGDEKSWRQIEKNMKIKFPQDYWDLIHTYGSGSFNLKGGGFVQIYNPFSRLYEENVLFLCENYRGFQDGEGKKAYPYKVFPKKGGLLGLGVDDLESNEIYWITKGDPDQWKLLHRSADNECQELEGPLTSFLAKVFSRQLALNLWSGSLPNGVKGVRFQAEATPPAPEIDPTTIYDLYRENGNKADFWVKDNEGILGYGLYHVKSIGGKVSGQLVWPFEYQILGDLYYNGELCDRESDLTMLKNRRSFLLVPPPKDLKLPSEFLMNIYALYAQNGNKAGFWVREPLRPAYAIFVKTVEGKKSGPLSVETVPAGDYRDYPVIADEFLQGKLETKDGLLHHAEHNSYIRVAPP
jgi:hypothetical protein